ncbi:hypothetical protein T08_7043 [Trichinella sp. T8]|nr:hypothetical protein T08_7043 [Trichinella sp. T8]
MDLAQLKSGSKRDIETVSITVMKLKASYEELHLVPILLCSVMRARLILEKDLSNSNNVQVRNDLQSINVVVSCML